MSILTGSLVFGSLNTELVPGAGTTLSRWWSGPVTMRLGLLATADAAPLAPASASSAAPAASARRRRLVLIRAPITARHLHRSVSRGRKSVAGRSCILSGGPAGLVEIDLTMTCSFPGGSIPLLLRCTSMASIGASSYHFLDIHFPGRRWQLRLAHADRTTFPQHW